MKKLTCLLLLILLSGCISVGHDFSSEKVSMIRNKKTTKIDILDMFGAPFRKGVDNNNESWTYVLNRYNILGETLSKDLYILFDKNGKVISYTYNSTK